MICLRAINTPGGPGLAAIVFAKRVQISWLLEIIQAGISDAPFGARA
jgi:hypothetical protein